MKKLPLLFALLLVLLGFSVNVQGSQTSGGIKTNGRIRDSKTYYGFACAGSDWYLGNWRQSYFAELRSYGFDTIMPEVWWAKIEKWDGTYQTTRIDNINSTINMALAEGLNVFLSFRVCFDPDVFSDWWTDWYSYSLPTHDYVNFNQLGGGKNGRDRYADFLGDIAGFFPQATGFCVWHFPYHMQNDEVGGRKATYEGATTTALINAIRAMNPTCKIIWCPSQQGTGNNGETAEWFETGSPPSACVNDDNILYGLGHMVTYSVCDGGSWNYDYGRMDIAFSGIEIWRSKFPNKPIVSVEYSPIRWNGNGLSDSRLTCVKESLQRMRENDVGWLYWRISLTHSGSDDILREDQAFELQEDLRDYLVAGL